MKMKCSLCKSSVYNTEDYCLMSKYTVCNNCATDEEFRKAIDNTIKTYKKLKKLENTSIDNESEYNNKNGVIIKLLETALELCKKEL